MFASCGYDKSVVIWTEKVVDGKLIYKVEFKILEFGSPVEDIDFCPRVHDLQLACATQKGKVLIYKPQDKRSYSNWHWSAKISVNSKDCTCVKWNPSLVDPQMFVTGGDYVESEPGTLLSIYKKKEKEEDYAKIGELEGHTDTITDVVWAPQAGRTFHLIASSSKDKTFRINRIDYDESSWTITSVKEVMKYVNDEVVCR